MAEPVAKPQGAEPKAAAEPPAMLLDFPYATDWDLVALFRKGSEAILPAPSCFLHSALEVRESTLRGRCVVAKEFCASGSLVLADAPLLVAPTYAQLLEDAWDRSADPAFRQTLLGFSGDEGDDKAKADAEAVDGAISKELVGRLLSRNFMEVESPPVDGQLTLEISPSSASKDEEQGDELLITAFGLWPLASLVNHASRPNATRFFVGHQVCYRLLEELQVGEEMVVNYLNPRLSHASRTGILAERHAIIAKEETQTDENDAPEDLISKVAGLREEADEHLQHDRLEEAMKCLSQATNLVDECGVGDPVFTDAFVAFSKVAGCMGGGEKFKLEGLAMALEFLTAREPYSLLSCAVSSQLLTAALEGGLPSEELEDVERLAREHHAKVYGQEFPGFFEAMNPALALQLAARQPPAETPSASASGAQKKRPAEEQLLPDEGKKARDA